MVHSNVNQRRAVLAALCATILGVGCGPGDQASLTILDPVDGAILTLATDTRPDLDGVQATVLVQAHRVAVGDTVSLAADDAVIGMATVPDSGELSFTDVTIPSGMHQLVAFTMAGDVRSPEITVTVNDGCATIDFVTPVAGGDRVTFGPADDTDGMACGESFETTVVISTDAGNGSEARVFVNGTPRRTGTVSGTMARFEGVPFDLGAAPNELAVEVVNSEGVTCRQTFATPIYVDCAGVSCRITAPDTTSSFLNQSNDVSDAPGFQGDFEVTTDADGAGQAVQLIIDGNETDALSAMPTPSGTDGVASFGNVALSEGVHRIQAVCKDAAGNPTRTSAEWTVDVTACDVAVTAPADGALFIDSDDVDSSLDGIQIAMNGTSTGTACTSFRVGHCGSLGDFQSLSGSSFDGQVTLSTSAMQDLCAEVQDAAGNVGEGRVSVRVRSDAPQLQITSPVAGTGFNAAGTGGRTADLTPGTGTCEAAFTVYCTDPGSTVTLVNDSGTTLPGGSSTCVADGSAPAPYAGVATFASVSLPSVESLGEVHVRARADVDRLVGLSDPITLLSDCESPVIDISRPMCGATLRPSDDADAATAGIQYRVDVINTNVPKPPVTLELRNTSGTTVFGPVTSSTPAGGVVTSFSGATFTVGGDVVMHACATDAAGNVGCDMDCTVSVQDIPTLSITQPTAGAVLSNAADCDGATPGLQLRVRATTNAAPGSSGTVQIGAASAVPLSVSGTTIDACVDAADGRNVLVTVTVTDAARGTAMATVRVNIDTMGPSTAIDDLILSEADRRGGIARFSWTAVDDAGGLRLDHYEARCSSAPITNEAEWGAATMVSVPTVPAMGGAVQSADVSGFRPGQPRYCVLRGVDIAGQLTPLPSAAPAPFEPTLLQQEITGTGNLGAVIVPVGDVNGDTIDDVLVSALDGHVYLYFGSTGATPLSGAPNVVFNGPASGGYGKTVGNIGDANGDGRPDFAISARAATVGSNGFAGAVWIFFGRDSTTPWPSSMSLALTSGACGSDVCLLGSTSGAFLGWSVGSAGDFDGDGFGDIAIDAWKGNGGSGRLYVLSGSSLSTGTSFTFPDTSAAPADPNGFVIDAPAGAYGMGVSVASPGNFVGDLRSDLVVGAIGDAPMSLLGRVYAVAGRAYPAASSGLIAIPSADLTEIASGPAGTFGSLVRSIGDYDGNGRVDVAVFHGTSAGRVTVYLQQATGFSVSSSFVLDNGLASSGNDLFGNSIGIGYDPYLGNIGDFDGDSHADLLVGSQQNGTLVGDVSLFYGTGATGALTRSAADFVVGRPDPFGTAPTDGVAAYVGDLNGDGFNDILVGDPSYTSGAGRFLLIY